MTPIFVLQPSFKEVEPKYQYGQTVEFKLDKFYQDCENIGVLVDYDKKTQLYTAESIVCGPINFFSTISPIKTMKIKEEDIIKTIGNK